MPVLSVGRGYWHDGVWYVEQDRSGTSYTPSQGLTDERIIIADFVGPVTMELVVEVSSNLLQSSGSNAIVEIERLYRGTPITEVLAFQGSVNPFQVTACAVGVRVYVRRATVQQGEVVVASVSPRSWPSWMRPAEAQRSGGCSCCR